MIGVHFVRRGLFTLAISAAIGSPAAAEPLWQARLQAGYGLAFSGNRDLMSRRPTPLTVTATAAFAFNADPPLWGYGGLAVETLDRNAAGVVFGVELAPHSSHLHVGAGGITMVAPYMLWGATANLGACAHVVGVIGVCGDVQLTAFIAGDDLADGRTVTQGQLVAGLVFDAL